MATNYLKYVGGFLSLIGGFILGFGYGVYSMYEQIVSAFSNIAASIPLIGSEVQSYLNNQLASYAPNEISYYVIGIFLFFIGMVLINLAKSTEALQPSERLSYTERPTANIPTVFCLTCGAENRRLSNYCERCGKKIRPELLHS